MSLSDAERLHGLYYGVLRINEVVRNWEEDHRIQRDIDINLYKRIRDLVKKLWPCLIGRNTNAIHWLTGGTCGNRITTEEPSDPWSIAIVGHLEDIGKRILYKEDAEESYYEKPFNALDFCSLDYLLSDEFQGVIYGYILRVYQHTEDLSYYLRRYKDDFLGRYSEVSDLISQIQGECFHAFARNEDYAKAYLVHEIMELLYGPRYPYDKNPDFMQELLDKYNTHHDLAKMMKWDIGELSRHHIDLVRVSLKAKLKLGLREYFSDEEYSRTRLFKVIEFVARNNPREFFFKEVEKSLQGSKDLATVRKIWEQHSGEALDREEKRKRKNDLEYESNSLNCYGFYGYSLIEDCIPDEEEPFPKPKPKPKKQKKNKKQKKSKKQK